jgi:hypothetical protein
MDVPDHVAEVFFVGDAEVVEGTFEQGTGEFR